MSDNVTLFPNLLQPAVALKTYAPLSIKFWENQGTTLEGMKEFTDGWFARRHKTTQAGIEAVKRMGEAATHFDILREYQTWLTGAIEALADDGKACQQQLLRTGFQLNPKPETRQADERRTG